MIYFWLCWPFESLGSKQSTFFSRHFFFKVKERKFIIDSLEVLQIVCSWLLNNIAVHFFLNSIICISISICSFVFFLLCGSIAHSETAITLLADKKSIWNCVNISIKAKRKTNNFQFATNLLNLAPKSCAFCVHTKKSIQSPFTTQHSLWLTKPKLWFFSLRFSFAVSFIVYFLIRCSLFHNMLQSIKCDKLTQLLGSEWK